MLYHHPSKHTTLPEMWTEQMASYCSSSPPDKNWSYYRNRQKQHHFFQKLILDILSSSRLAIPRSSQLLSPGYLSPGGSWLCSSCWCSNLSSYSLAIKICSSPLFTYAPPEQRICLSGRSLEKGFIEYIIVCSDHAQDLTRLIHTA